ncbi:MAG: CvpA family protein, partial [Rhodothermaceae bacterium]|nr:CvpA family protein [Rhodothermaceae bacterium]
MAPIDILILALFVIGVIRGIFTGGIKQVLSIVGVIAGLLLAISLSEPFSNLLVRQNWVSETLAPAVSFVVIFFLVQVVVLAVTYVLRSALEKIKLGGLDKALGGIVGGGKA